MGQELKRKIGRVRYHRLFSPFREKTRTQVKRTFEADKTNNSGIRTQYLEGEAQSENGVKAEHTQANTSRIVMEQPSCN